MDTQIYLTILYDYYGSLLTNTQQAYFEDYYFNNLSLMEISENYSVSRNAIHKSLKDTEAKLLFYESKLHLNEKANKIKIVIEKIDDKRIKEQIEELI